MEQNDSDDDDAAIDKDTKAKNRIVKKHCALLNILPKPKHDDEEKSTTTTTAVSTSSNMPKNSSVPIATTKSFIPYTLKKSKEKS